MDQELTIYVIYASENKDIMLRLIQQLQSVEEDYNISIWQDNPIESEKQWEPKEESRLATTDIFLLLISNAFMHSEFINQLEFKMMIDRYKEGKAKVIPLLVDQCPWDIDFNSEDYNFNFKELEVLPVAGKPISDWNTPDQAYDKITTAIREVITSFGDDYSSQEDVAIDLEEKPTNDNKQDQVEIDFIEKPKVDSELQNRQMEEVEMNRRIEEEERRIEEEETKRIAEETEARRLEEEKQLVKEAEARRRAKQERILKEKVNQDQLKANTTKKVEQEEAGAGESTNQKKIVLLVSIVAILAIVGIWAFSGNVDDSEKSTVPVSRDDTIETKDAKAIPETKVNASQVEESYSELVVGDSYEGGIVFTIDSEGKKGKVIHLEDAGPMPWKDAIKIHEQLGEGWRLPTLNELRELYKTVGQGASNIAEFSNGMYWSATDYDEYQARLLRFRDGNTSYHYNKEAEHRKFRVRAVRDFRR